MMQWIGAGRTYPLYSIGYGLEGKGFYSWKGQGTDFPSSTKYPEHFLCLTQPCDHWVQWVLSLGSRGWGM